MVLIRSVPWLFIATSSCEEPQICSITFVGLPDSKAWEILDLCLYLLQVYPIVKLGARKERNTMEWKI